MLSIFLFVSCASNIKNPELTQPRKDTNNRVIQDEQTEVDINSKSESKPELDVAATKSQEPENQSVEEGPLNQTVDEDKKPIEKPQLEVTTKPQQAPKNEFITSQVTQPKPMENEITKPAQVDEVPNIAKEETRSIRGKVDFTNPTDAKLESAIVYFKPEDNLYPNMTAKSFEISTKNKRFEPSVLAIPVGSEVSFPNLDRILHNVFSVSPESSFDLGLYSAGTAKTVKFDKPGIIYVHCNVHHSMQADILVLETPWYSQVNEDGTFEIAGLPNQSGTLYAWHPRANLNSQKIDSMNSNNLTVGLEVTRQLVPKHLNKFGKSYRPEKE
jgi:plastocyanin